MNDAFADERAELAKEQAQEFWAEMESYAESE